MSKVFEYFKEKEMYESVPSMPEVDYSTDMEEMIRIMKQAETLLIHWTEEHIPDEKNIMDCINSLQLCIASAEGTIHQFDMDLIKMEKELKVLNYSM